MSERWAVMRAGLMVLGWSVAAGALVAAPPTAPERVDLLVAGGRVVTMDASRRVLDDGAVAILGHRMVAVGPRAELQQRFRAVRTIEAHGKLVTPGLVNTHTHLPMTLLRGISDDVDLMTWLQQYIWPAENRNVSPEFVTAGALLGAWELIRTGTTTFADMYFFEDQVAEAARQAGLRAVCAAAVLDIPVPDHKTADEGLQRAEAFLRKWQGHGLVTPAVGPHSAYTCSPDTLRRARALAERHRAPLLIHLAESPGEMKMVRDKYGLSPVAHLDRIGFLGPDVLGAHGVWLDDADIAVLKAREVGLAHCPQSNMKLSSGVARIPELLRAGVRVGLGTDGAASNNDLSLFEEMDTACKLQKLTRQDASALTAEQAVDMATLGGARALHMEDRLGSLEPGKQADLIVVALDSPSAVPLYDVYSHLVYALKGSDVETVIIGGRPVMEGRRLLTLDTTRIAAQARELQRAVLKSLERK